MEAIIGYRVEDIEILEDTASNRPSSSDGPGDEGGPRMNAVKGVIVDTAFIGPMRRFMIRLENGDEIQTKHSSKFLAEFKKDQEVLVGFHERPMVFKYPDDLRYELSKA